jgi:hypothetical protein
LVLALLLSGLGCTAAPAPSTREPESIGFGKALPRSESAHWLGPDALRARSAGADDAELLAMQPAAPGDRVLGVVSVPDNQCVLLIARAGESVLDLDLYAYGDDGTVLGVDEAADKTPTFVVCPPHPKHIYVAARVVAGHGLVAIGAQQVRPAEVERVTASLRMQRPEHEEEARAQSRLNERLAEHRRRLGGTWQDVRRTSLPLDPRVPSRFSVLVDERGCLDIFVIPSDEVSHLDMTLTDESGRIVGRGTAEGRDRSLLVCSPRRAPVTVELRPFSGRGLAVAAVSRSTSDAYELTELGVARVDLSPVGEARALAAKHSERLDELGYDAPQLLGEIDLGVGRRSSVRIELAKGCHRVDMLGAAAGSGINAWLWSESGSLLAQTRTADGGLLYACTEGGPTRLDLEPRVSSGRARIELRSEQRAPEVLTAHPLAASRLLLRMQSRGVLRVADHTLVPRAFTASPDRNEHLDVLLLPGRCVDVSLALGPGATGAEVRLINRESGEELDFARGTHSAGARACAAGRGRTFSVRAELRARAGRADALAAARILTQKP